MTALRAFIMRSATVNRFYLPTGSLTEEVTAKPGVQSRAHLLKDVKIEG